MCLKKNQTKGHLCPCTITLHSVGPNAWYIDDFVRVPSIPTRGSSFTGVPFGIPQPVLIGLIINQALLSAVYKGLHLSRMAIAHSTEQNKEKLKQRRAAMVKILEIGGGRLDAEDDDCCEIDPAEFAKKLNLKASDGDDVVVVAAKGQVGSSHSLFLSLSSTPRIHVWPVNFPLEFRSLFVLLTR